MNPELTVTWFEIAQQQERDCWTRFNGSGSTDAGAWSAIQYWREQKRAAKARARMPALEIDTPTAPPSPRGYTPPLLPPAPITPGPGGAAVVAPRQPESVTDMIRRVQATNRKEEASFDF